MTGSGLMTAVTINPVTSNLRSTTAYNLDAQIQAVAIARCEVVSDRTSGLMENVRHFRTSAPVLVLPLHQMPVGPVLQRWVLVCSAYHGIDTHSHVKKGKTPPAHLSRWPSQCLMICCTLLVVPGWP